MGWIIYCIALGLTKRAIETVRTGGMETGLIESNWPSLLPSFSAWQTVLLVVVCTSRYYGKAGVCLVVMMESGCDSGEVHTRHDCELLLLLLLLVVGRGRGRGRGQLGQEQSQCPRSLLVLHQQSCAPYQIVTHLPYRTDIYSVPEHGP